ncbi:aminotransferase class I/II-fold pyridoxal phosphate-dependent enzyme [Pantanalinema sp. GBBB05]|uniref:aminotransferase class I/II-fold pyridoxal phosphate-dependent enzyme n=1 Tax=Pantanalinema sp. GBBB05 TaxID=2604139 RepID=UPI001D9336CD|nr:DegT/DnrJ/EryC1/StrS aminotransferase family protein [Pantanalinema sp. GBBB05]
MIPRGTPDIGWRDLAIGAIASLQPHHPDTLQTQVETLWSANHDSLVCLSVRSGFDLWLQAIALPPGSEVLVSAITIPDMVRILEHHGLVAVPVDLEMATLSVDYASLERSLTSKTKAILVAHLFGSRMSLESIAEFARQHHLLLIEDCAQAYDGSDYRGHPASDISLFSFGPIKTHTALGGALLRCQNQLVLAKLRSLQAHYPHQRSSVFLKRVGLFALLKLLAQPMIFGWFVQVCRWRGQNHDRVLYQALRGFAGQDLFQRLRQQPCIPLLRLLKRRLTRIDHTSIDRRIDLADRLITALPHTDRPGYHTKTHTHWVFPIQTQTPDQLVTRLWQAGFDATRTASSLVVVSPPVDRPHLTPNQASQALAKIIYLPLYPWMSEDKLQSLSEIVRTYDRHAE